MSAETHPEHDLDLLSVLTRAGSRLRSSAPGVNRLCAEFNDRYFGGRLPALRVKYSVRLGSGRINRPHKRGTYHPLIRLITLDALLGADEVERTLIHEMIHAAGYGKHDEAFAAEARRLRDLGAPIYEKDLTVRPDIPS